MPSDACQMFEVRAGLIASAQREKYPEDLETFDNRFFNAASPALVFPDLTGREEIELVGMSEGGRMVVRLPGSAPELSLRTGATLQRLQPEVQRILVSLEEGGVSIVWHASVPASEDIFRRMPTPDDDLEDLVRVDALVNGQPVPMTR